jgi:hypothetical protein
VFVGPPSSKGSVLQLESNAIGDNRRRLGSGRGQTA